MNEVALALSGSAWNLCERRQGCRQTIDKSIEARPENPDRSLQSGPASSLGLPCRNQARPHTLLKL